MATPKIHVSENLRVAATLLLLTVQTSVTTVITNRSRLGEESQELYSTPTLVLLGELLKLIASLVLLSTARDTPGHLRNKSASFTTRLKESSIHILSQKDAWKMSIPAALYVVQNNLQLFALSSVSPVTYQTLTQLRIIFVSIFATLFLRRTMTKKHWSFIFLLVAGLIVIKIDDNRNLEDRVALPSTGLQDTSLYQADVIGSLAVMVSIIIGSLAGIIIEKQFKEGETSLWVYNAQLSMFSLLPAAALIITETMNSPVPQSPFRGLGIWAWLTVLLRAGGGLLVAFVLKYADNILKAFSTSASIVLTLLMSSFISKAPISIISIEGAFFVVVSTIGFALADAEQIKNKAQHHLPVTQKRPSHCIAEGDLTTDTISTSATPVSLLVDVR